MNRLLKFVALNSAIMITSTAAIADQLSSVNRASLSALESIDRFNSQSIQVADIKRVVAQTVALELSSKQAGWLNQLNSANKLNFSDLGLPATSAQLSAQASEQTRQLKGLSSQGSNVYQLRLADDSMLSQWQGGQVPLIAFAPRGDDTEWLHVEAFDANGELHLLDAQKMPTRPVLVVELDKQLVQREGIEVMRKVFNQNRELVGGNSNTLSLGFLEQQAAPISTSVISRIRLNDDKEPWISGAAEVYAVVNGVSPTRDEPALDVVDLPYLDHDGQDYTPNQILIHWERYRWQAADVLLMEHDDNTNYQELATTFLNIVTQVMRLIPDPNVQGYAIIPQLTNELIKAMPSHWFTNDDDYVDVFYTLFENRQYNNVMGASNNAKMTLSPLTIEPR
ncbi:DUF3103 family protein [Pseudoalteromonas luteoviolacea]|uniref:DUF3103 domain-containing protein n=1 Tax=Pseudoalteromonas luteoviolacea NCIMB 1942 TaxID=1365253 RepID=A0A167BUE0_9GAMM|nr:DUF3103 family protein [Pseudoalteromonas luteoviolacea]KZN46911.1 hypothetical protein N482_10895 [Pseudoalteromonas luteoviolacea NCIMB 1942]KZX02268.1 hypothetical protein JL49_00885 [Pseudoalteromonas luteoviolacea]